MILIISNTIKSKLKKTDFHYSNFTKSNDSKPELYLIFITVTLSWGGWWAAQEGSWGGWWNWDPSEVFGLMLMTIYILKVHANQNSNNSINLKFKINLWLWSFIFVYYLIQLNFDLVSHNFGTRSHQFIDSYGLYISLLTLTSLKLISLFKQSLLKSIFNYFKIYKSINKLIIVILSIIISILILLSFSELIINLLWTLLSINFLNNTIEISYLVNLLIYVLLIKIYNFNILNALVLIYIVNTSWIFKIIFISLVSISGFSKLHTITWSWILLSFFNINQSLSQWDLPLVDNKNLVDYFSIKLNNSGIEHLVIIYNEYHLQDVIWGLIKNNSNTTQPSFLHLNTSHNFIQTLKTFLLELSHSITILDYNTNILSLLGLTWLFYILKTIKLKTLIIF